MFILFRNCFLLFITYLCGHNNPIIVFRPALKFLSRCPYFALIYGQTHFRRLRFDSTKRSGDISHREPNDVNVDGVHKKLDTLIENSAIATHTRLPSHNKRVALSETSHCIKRFEEVLSFLDGAVWVQSFTQNACKDLICDWEKANTLIVGTYRGVFLFHDRTQSTKVPIAGHAFFQQYSADNTPYQLITSGLKQLSWQAVRPCSLVVFESLYRNSELVMAGRRYLNTVVVDWWQFAVFSSSEINVAIAIT